MKKSQCFLLVFFIILSCNIFACGLREIPESVCDTEKAQLVPVAEIIDFSIPSLSKNVSYTIADTYLLQENGIVYVDGGKHYLCKIFLDEMDATEKIYETASGVLFISLFTLGCDKNWYVLEYEQIDAGERQYYLKKLDLDFQEICSYSLNIQDSDMDGGESVFDNLVSMEADDAGNIVLCDIENNLYLFDKEGKYLGTDAPRSSVLNGGIVNAGESGCYFWNSVNRRLILQEIDFKSGSLKEEIYVDLMNYVGAVEMYTLISGYQKGILLSTDSTLWQYNPKSEEMVRLLAWNDSHINVDGYTVEQITFQKARENGAEDMIAFCDDVRNNQTQLVRIYQKNRSEVEEKQTIEVAIYWTTEVENWVNRFNQSNEKYQVKLKNYDSMEDLMEDLLFHKEDAPDILDIALFSPEMLNSKELLADLEPYFEKSKIVCRDDIFEQVWEACCYEGKLTSILCNFYFGTCISTVEDLSENGWSYEDFFALEGNYPDSSPLMFYSDYNVWSFIKSTGINDFIDWNNKKSYFNSEDFQKLMVDLRECNYTDNTLNSWTSREEIEWLLSGEFLLLEKNYDTPMKISSIPFFYDEEFGVKMWNVGYPTLNGEPCYFMNSGMHFAIFNESPDKDGAWAFLEYVLSEAGQDWYAEDFHGFPVRKDSFEEFLQKPVSRTGEDSKKFPTEEDIEEIYFMLENSRLSGKRNIGEVDKIIWEELQAFYADAKTVEETAEIIQRRVMLYLTE